MQMRNDAALKAIVGTFVIFPDLITPPYIRYENGQEVTYFTTTIGIGEYTIDQMFLNRDNANKVLLNPTDVNNNTCNKAATYTDLKWFEIKDLIPVVPPSQTQSELNAALCDGYSKNGVLDCLNIKQNYVNIYHAFGDVKDFSIIPDQRFSTYKYLVNELVDFSNYSVQDFERTKYVELHPDDEDAKHLKRARGYSTKGARLDFLHPINGFEIDISTPDGIYRIDKGGLISGPKSVPTYISFKMCCYQLDENGNEINMIKNTFWKSMETGKKQRWTYRYSLPEGEGWYIKLSNNTDYPELDGETIVNGFQIDRIKGLSTYTAVNTKDITYALIRVKIGDIFDGTSNIKFSLKVTRKGLTKMNDVINYIWESGGYNYLELSQTNDLLSKFEVHGAMDAAAPIYEQINRILRAQELYLIPTINGFKVREDLERDNLTYVFDKSNIIKSSLDVSYINYNKKINDGYRAVYIDDLGIKQDVVYPLDAYYPQEQILFGVKDKTIAEKRAKIGYQRMLGQNKTIKFKTEKEGYIPELGDKVGVAEYYLSDTSTATKISYTGQTIHLDKQILLTGDDYVSIKNTVEDPQNYRKITTGPGYTRDIEIEGYFPNDEITAFIVGKERKLLKEYLVKEISPSSDGISLTCIIYNKEIYR